MGVIIIDSKEEERAREGLGVTVTTTVCCHRCQEWLCWQVGGYLNCVLQCLVFFQILNVRVCHGSCPPQQFHGEKMKLSGHRFVLHQHCSSSGDYYLS